MSDLCKDVYVTQDGYDSGLKLVCHTHGTDQAIMDPSWPGHQAYDLTLDLMLELVRKHSEEKTDE